MSNYLAMIEEARVQRMKEDALIQGFFPAGATIARRLVCSKHPGYAAKRPPKSNCVACQAIWDLKNE